MSCSAPLSTVSSEAMEVLQRLADRLPCLIYRVHVRQGGRMQFLNQQGETITGYDADELCHGEICGLDPLIVAEDRLRVLAEVEQAVTGKRPFAVDYRLKHKDGTLRHLLEQGVPVDGEDGAPLYIDGVIFDLTEQMVSEGRLHEFTTFNEQVIQCAKEGIIVYGPDLRYRVWNRCMEKMTGKSAREVLGRHPLEVFPFLQDVGIVERLEKTLRGEAQPTIEFPNLSGTGEVGWTADSCSPLRNATGEIIGVIATVRDVTEKKKIEDALLHSREKYRSLYHETPIMLHSIDQTGMVVNVNDFWLKTMGYDDRHEVLGRKVTDFYTEESRHYAEHVVQPAFFRDGFCKDITFQFVRKDGEVIDVLLSATGERDATGHVVRSRAVIQDITSQRRAEEEKARVDEQLRQAQKMDSIGTLAGGIAHDFNNILNAIVGYTDLAMMRGADEFAAMHDDLHQVRKAADRATALVRQILTFSRKQPQEKTPLQVSLVVKEAMKLLRASIPSTIDIRQDIVSQATVMADLTQIHQLVINLCTNAYHAMQERGGLLLVSVKDVAIEQRIVGSGVDLSPGRYVVLSVSDTGCGIAPEIVPRIFEPYFTTKAQGKGTGLGLAVVHGIVESHHGRIAVYSELGRGAIFSAYLPMIVQEAETEKAAPVAPPRSRAGERIMVVDDESSICDLVCQCLSLSGYRPTAFVNGLEAWQALFMAPNDWDLLLTDQTMPEMTGDQLAAKALQLRPSLPVIICSGYSALLNSEKAKRTGVFAYLQKPVEVNLLLNKVFAAFVKE